MKKLCFALPVLVLALFLAACGKTPDQELKSKVPASANGLFLFDGTNATKTKMYADNKEMFLKEVKEAKLPEDIFQCRVLFFGSIKVDISQASFRMDCSAKFMTSSSLRGSSPSSLIPAAQCGQIQGKTLKLSNRKPATG